MSSRLRVSEKVLDDDLPSALLVYKGAILLHSLLALLNELVPETLLKSKENPTALHGHILDDNASGSKENKK